MWLVPGASIACFLTALLFVLLFRPSEPRIEGRSLGYWLDRLQPTVITPTQSIQSWPSQKFHNQTAVKSWIAQSMKRHERSLEVLETAGPECLPILLARLTARPTRSGTGFLRRCAYTLRLVDSVPNRAEEYNQTEIRRGQAVTAIVFLGDRAAGLVPKLSAIAAEDKNDAVHRAASHALFQVAPDEFRRIRTPRVLATSEPDGR